MEYTKALSKLIDEYQKLPGVGPKSAQRMAFFTLKRTREQLDRFIHAVRDAKEKIRQCINCFNLSSNETCEICTNHKREKYEICVVPEVKDLVALERTKEFSGLYHVLGGVISPLDGISADDLNITELIFRVKNLAEELKASGEATKIELILAISPSTEGEATILYMKRLLKDIASSLNCEIDITRLAYGLPVGADLDYTDELTLARALQGRQPC